MFTITMLELQQAAQEQIEKIQSEPSLAFTGELEKATAINAILQFMIKIQEKQFNTLRNDLVENFTKGN